eukprot:GEMP01030845.1.p1 GENE.GEMP01030845.1~~GEMP01030845.1.p1  ORF type:complete len:576 (+),score=129.48 GEMP01030845.1:218-1945(+)
MAGTDVGLGDTVDETAEKLIEKPLSEAVCIKLASRPTEEVIEAACKVLEAHAPIRGFVINSLTSELKRAHQLIEMLQQASFLTKANDRLLAAASTCLEKLQGAIILRKLQDVYPKPFAHAMKYVSDTSTLGYLRDTRDLLQGLIDYPLHAEDAAQAIALINGICAEYLNAVVREREQGVMRPYLGNREEVELLIENSRITEGSPGSLWYLQLAPVFRALCDHNSQGANPAMLSYFRSFASTALRAFVGWEAFADFRDKIIATLWKLEERANFALDLAEQYEAVTLLARMTYQSNESRLHAHVLWSARFRDMVLEHFLQHDLLPEFCAILDKCSVPYDILEGLLLKYPTHRWAIDIRRKKSIVRHCEEIANENICANGNSDFTPQDCKVSPAAHAALARIASFAEGYPTNNLPCGTQLHIVKLHRKYLGKPSEPITYRSYLDVLNQFSENLQDLAQKSRDEMLRDVRELIAMIEDAEYLRTPYSFAPSASTEDALRKFWLAVLELDREQLLTIAGASKEASEQLIKTIIAETAFGLLLVAGPKIPRSAEFLITAEEPEVRILRPALELCMNQASVH